MPFASQVKRRSQKLRRIGIYTLGAIFLLLLARVFLTAIAAATGHIE
jgi:hypothetical protein